MTQISGVQPVLQRSYRLMLLPAVIAVLVFAVLPLVGMFVLSFTGFDLVKGWDTGFTFENFTKLASDKRFIGSIWVMLALSVFGVIAQVIAGTLIAVGLEKIIPRWRHVRGFFVVPFVVPHVAVALIWLLVF